MDLSSISPVLLIASIMVSATPILLAAIGEMVVEKAGVLNLGVEGLMIIGAVTGFATAVSTGSPFLGFVAASLAAAIFSMAFGLLTQFLLSNQVATGLGLWMIGLGVSSLVGKSYEGMKSPPTPKLDIPVLSDLPVVGRMLFSHDAMVYLSLLLVLAVWAFLKFTRAGLILRAVGESHDSAHALGYKVVLIRLAAIFFGGACAGLGGAYISLVRVPQWTEGMTAGIGWIALAIVVFASWRPGRVLIGAYLFGGINVLQLNLQAVGANVPVALLSASPFIVTILVLVIISARGHHGAPASLGRPFHATT